MRETRGRKIRCSLPSLSGERPREPPGRVGILVARLALMSSHGVFAEARLGIPRMEGPTEDTVVVEIQRWVTGNVVRQLAIVRVLRLELAQILHKE
jgi:hypothetical protein